MVVISLLLESILGFPGGSDGKESACNARDPGSIPGLERSAGEGHGSPPQCSCLENPWTEGSCQLQSIQSQRVRHEWAANTSTFREHFIYVVVVILKNASLEKEMATHSNTLAWEIPWTDEPGGLQSRGSQRMGQNLVTSFGKLHFH